MTMTCRSPPPPHSDATPRVIPSSKPAGNPENPKTTSSRYKNVKRGSALEQLLNEYDTGHGYFLTHLDMLDRWEKVLAFVPNLFFNGLCVYMVHNRVTRYLPLVLDKVFLLRQPVCGDHYNEPFYATLFHAAVDYYLVTQFFMTWWSTTRAYFWLRLCYGFNKTELIFRKPTMESIQAMSNSPDKYLRKRWDDYLRRALSKELTQRDPGCFSEVGFWILEHDAVHAAYEAAAKGNITLDTWHMKIWRKVDGAWRVWDATAKQQPDPW